MATIYCDWFRAEIMSQFQALEDYLRHSEAQIQDSHHTMRAQILSERQPTDASYDDVQEWLSLQHTQLENCNRKFTGVFQQTLRFSVVTSIFSLIESNLSRVAMEICRRLHLNLDLEDLQAKDLVRRFKKFWSKVANLNWWDDPRWDALKDIEALRNCIAHRRGVVKKHEKRIENIAADEESHSSTLKHRLWNLMKSEFSSSKSRIAIMP